MAICDSVMEAINNSSDHHTKHRETFQILLTSDKGVDESDV